LVLVDISTAQELTGRQGLIDRIDLILAPTEFPASNATQPPVSDAIKALLPAGTRLQPVAARRGAIEEMTSAFRVNLTALSLLALLVGLFLIYNTMTFSVIQRRPLLGTLRCLGTTRREIFLMVLSEAFLIGSLGSALGVLLGIALGQGAVQLVTQTINDLFFVVNVRSVQIPIGSLIKGFLIGTFTTLLTAAPPAWEAAAVSPRTALYRSGLEAKAQKAVNLVAFWGAVLIAVGAVTLILIPTSNLVVSFAGTFAVIVGFAMLTPFFTKFSALYITPLLGWIFGILGRMAPRDVSKSISRTSIAIAALMVAVSVTIGVSLMISSFRYTVETWLEQTLQGDIYVSAPGLTATQPGSMIDPKVIEAVRATEGIAEVAQLRALTVDSPSGSVNLTAIDHPVRSAKLFLAAVGNPDQVWQAMQNGAVIVSEPYANRLNLPGIDSTIQLFTDQGLVEFPVAGIFSDYASTQGTIRMDLNTFRRYWNDDKISTLALFLEPGTNVQRVTRDLQDRLSPIQQVLVRPNSELRQEALQVFDRTFAITGAMRLLATLVAFIGVLSTLLSLQLEKQRQFGILRAVGLTLRQIWGLIFLETGFMGSIAGLLAMPAGYVLSLILVYIINRRSFGWTLQMQVNPEPFLIAFGVALAAALLAGIYPALRMGKMATAEALRSE
ncbi:MAG: ABC transporter permease, partial [Anaerolineales bacterium]